MEILRFWKSITHHYGRLLSYYCWSKSKLASIVVSWDLKRFIFQFCSEIGMLIYILWKYSYLEIMSHGVDTWPQWLVFWQFFSWNSAVALREKDHSKDMHRHNGREQQHGVVEALGGKQTCGGYRVYEYTQTKSDHCSTIGKVELFSFKMIYGYCHTSSAHQRQPKAYRRMITVSA